MDAADFSEASQFVYNTLECAIRALSEHLGKELDFEDLTESSQEVILLMQRNLCRNLGISVTSLLEDSSRRCVLQAP
jgi:hypothetical protein